MDAHEKAAEAGKPQAASKTFYEANYTNIHEAFRATMADDGMVVHEPLIADGLLHRVYVDDDKRGSKNGAYILHLDGRPSGYFEHFRTGIRSTWSLSGKREPMSFAMRQQIEASRQQRRLEQQQSHKAAAEKARVIWNRANPILDIRDHHYLIRKGVRPCGLRITKDGKALIVPMYNVNKELVNLQFINADGNKRFLSGGKKKGCFAVIGKHLEGKPILICEGWATGASLYDTTGHFVVVAMDAGNLTPVAEAIRALDAKAKIIIMGDNDESGKGQTEARKAALSVGGKYLIPETPGYDWNDVMSKEVV